MATTTTLATLYERLAENLWPGRKPQKIAATGGGTTTFVVSSMAYASAHPNAYDYSYILILTDAGGAGAAPEHETRQIVRGGFVPANGTWTVSPAYSAAVASTDTGLFLYGLHADELLEAVNDVQRSLAIPRWLPLTLASGGDMEGVIADFTDVGTPTTKEMVTTAAHTLLRQAMHLVCNSGIGKTTSNIPVIPGENLFISVPTKVTAGSVTVTLYDVTNSAAIRSVTVSDSDFADIRFDESVPATCKNVTIRTLGAEASSNWYTGWIAVLYQDRRVYNLPSAIAGAADVEDVLHLPAYYSASTNDSYLMLSQNLEHWPWYEFPRDWRGANSNRIAINRVINSPIFLKFRTPGAVLAAMTDTTVAPEAVVLQGALAFLLEKMAGATTDERTKRDLTIRQLRASQRYAALLHSEDLLRPVPEVAHSIERVRVPW